MLSVLGTVKHKSWFYPLWLQFCLSIATFTFFFFLLRLQCCRLRLPLRHHWRRLSLLPVFRRVQETKRTSQTWVSRDISSNISPTAGQYTYLEVELTWSSQVSNTLIFFLSLLAIGPMSSRKFRGTSCGPTSARWPSAYSWQSSRPRATSWPATTCTRESSKN